VMFDSFKTDYSLLVRDLEHIKLPENAWRVREAFSIELFIPITTLMQSAIDAGQISGEAKFLARLFMGIVESNIARAGEYGLDNAALAKKLAVFFLQGARKN
jgi:hypothetical protein